MQALTHLLAEPTWIFAMLAVAAAGFVRGFAGFGAAMLFIPVATYLYEPSLVVVSFFLIDWLVTLPLAANALKKWQPRTVLPAVFGAWAGVWLGALLLISTPTLTLRWAICLVIIALACVMLSRWRYTGAPKVPYSLAVGIVSGILGGVSQVSAPPVVAYWAAGPASAATIRANMISFFFFASLGTLVAFVTHGVFNAASIALAALLAPAYGLAILAGAASFKPEKEALYRTVALAIILLAAITALPLLDPLLRP